MVWKYILRTAVALCLAAPVAVAQLLTTGAGCTTVSCNPTAVVSYTGPGDIVSGATFWVGLRAYTSAIVTAGTQKLINLSRASDSHTCDVIVSASGGLGNTANCSTGGDNGAAVATWCNATTCSITEEYDQTANANNFSQSTGADQPTLTFSCIGSLQCGTYNGSSDFLVATVTSFAQPNSLSSIALDATSSAQQSVLIFGNALTQMGFYNNDTNAFIYANGSVVNVSAATNKQHAMNANFQGASSIFNVDGATSTNNPGSQTLLGNQGVNIGKGFTTQFMNGQIQESGYWGAKAFSSGNATSVCENQQAYYGATNFGASC